MSKRIWCLCLIAALLLSGCGGHSVDVTDTATTTTSVSTTDSYTTTSTTTSTDATTSFDSTITTAQTTITTDTTTTTSVSTGTTTTTSASIETVLFKVTVRENINKSLVPNVTVTVYVNDNEIAAGSGVTDSKGIAVIQVPKGNSYRVKLSDLPIGYEANKEYLFASNTVNVIIRKAAVQNEADHSNAQYKVGNTMTNFSLTDSDGETYRLSQLLQEKKLIILDFWFATCEPCKSEFPYFEAATKRYGENVALLAVNPFDSNHTINQLRNQLNANNHSAVSFPMLQDTCNLYLGFGVTAFPTTVFIDANGVILDIHIGAYPSEEALFAAIERYVEQ